MQDTQKVSSELQDGSRTTKEKSFIYKGDSLKGRGKKCPLSIWRRKRPCGRSAHSTGKVTEPGYQR